ncbi:hypothetical protein EVAR_22659_1 [Eumeta japonica]|uniref:Uncharacterized protein n=1 Tax=Eumeta variegata TaxID=151549 RepID=A0A4C1VKX0_EUMVA|nr:hypothetical protein EVAR_22659_1 [Eumeta japonica]
MFIEDGIYTTSDKPSLGAAEVRSFVDEMDVDALSRSDERFVIYGAKRGRDSFRPARAKHALGPVNERFGQLDEYSESWSFLYNIKQIPEKPDLVKLCGDLQLKLTVDPKSDIDGCMLCDELIKRSTAHGRGDQGGGWLWVEWRVTLTLIIKVLCKRVREIELVRDLRMPAVSDLLFHSGTWHSTTEADPFYHAFISFNFSKGGALRKMTGVGVLAHFYSPNSRLACDNATVLEPARNMDEGYCWKEGPRIGTKSPASNEWIDLRSDPNLPRRSDERFVIYGAKRGRDSFRPARAKHALGPGLNCSWGRLRNLAQGAGSVKIGTYYNA